MDFISQAIEFVLANPLRKKDKDSWERLKNGCSDFICSLDTRATGILYSFEIVGSEYVNGGFYLESKTLDPQVNLLVNDLWQWLGGTDDPVRAREVLVATCIEFARAQLHCALMGIAIRESDYYDLGDPMRSSAASLEEDMKLRLWGDADAIARSPRPSTWFNQSAAFDYSEWLYNTQRGAHPKLAHLFREPAASMNPSPSAPELLHAITLVWLDEAARDSANAMCLMTGAIEASGDAGFRWGWELHEKDGESGTSRFAKKGAAARHAHNHARREKRIDAFRSGNFGTVKDRAAEALAKEFNVSWRTARDYLTGI